MYVFAKNFISAIQILCIFNKINIISEIVYSSIIAQMSGKVPSYVARKLVIVVVNQ